MAVIVLLILNAKTAVQKWQKWSAAEQQDSNPCAPAQGYREIGLISAGQRTIQILVLFNGIRELLRRLLIIFSRKLSALRRVFLEFDQISVGVLDPSLM